MINGKEIRKKKPSKENVCCVSTTIMDIKNDVKLKGHLIVKNLVSNACFLFVKCHGDRHKVNKGIQMLHKHAKCYINVLRKGKLLLEI
jgi:hypothetical protein